MTSRVLHQEPTGAPRAARRAAVLGALIVLAGCLAATNSWAAGYPMFPSLGVSDKPQSKLWHNAGSWWAAMNGTNHIGIYELATNVWTERDSVCPAVPPVLMGGTCDALWDGTHLYVAAFDSVAAKLYKFAYVDSTRHHVLQPGFPVSIPTGPGSETITICKDGTGRLWVTNETAANVQVRYTAGSDTTWAGPVVLGTLVGLDDISAILTYKGKVGVLWSNQQDWAFYFRSHNDADPPTLWSPTESVFEGVGVADDHISLAADKTGRVFAALKDQWNHLLVARRNLDGTWTTNPDILYGQAGTRPIILVDDAKTKLYCLYTRWPNFGHIGTNWIEYRVANYNTLVFGVETVLISATNVSMNNVQSTKQSLVDSSLVAICDASDGKAYWNGWGPISGIGGTGGGGTLPAPPGAPAPPTAGTGAFAASTFGVAAYKLDEGDGPTSADASGRGHTLVLGNAAIGDAAEPQWTSGITGNGLRLDGIYDMATIPSASDIAFAGSFTVETWVKTLGQPDKMVLLNKGSSTTRNYRLMTTRSGGVDFSFKDGAGVEHLILADGAILDNNWHHVAGVWDATAGQLRLYIDGVLRASGASTAGPAPNSDPLWIGARQTVTGLGNYLFGILDQIHLTASADYLANFAPPLTFAAQQMKYVRLTWNVPAAQAGIKGYNIFRSSNGSPLGKINGLVPVTVAEYNDATAVDGFLTYTVTGVDMLGQEGPQSTALNLEFESYDPLPPDVPRAYAVSRHATSGSIVAAFPLDEASGQTIRDAAGNGYNGFLGRTSGSEAADPLWAPGISGSGLDFDGAADYATIPDALGLRIPGSMTIEAWFKLSQTGLLGALVAKGGSSQRNYRVMVLTSGKIEFSWDATTGQAHKLTSTAAVTDLNWHHVACVYDAEAGRTRIYLDGKLAGTQAETGTPRTGGDALYFGARQSSSSLKDFFKGRIDMVQIASAATRNADFTPPTSLGSSAGGGYVTLRWTLPQIGLVRGYNIYRRLDGELPPVQRLNADVLWTETTFTDQKPHIGANCYWVRAVNARGVEGIATQTTCAQFANSEVPTDASAAPAAGDLALRLAPNPFNPTTRIFFRLERAGDASLTLYDVAGRRARDWKLHDLEPGSHVVPLPLTEEGGRLGSGIYFLRLRASGQEATARLVLLK